MNSFKKLIANDKKGAMTPFLLIITVIMLMMAVISLLTVNAFYTRTIARNAFDAALFSAMLSATSLETHPTYFYYTVSCTDCEMRTFSLGSDEDGNCLGTYDDCVCIQWTYYDAEGRNRSFIYFDEPTGHNVFASYLEHNIDSNIENAEIVNFTFNVVEYDDLRFLNLYKNRPLNRPSTASQIFLTTNPHSWWLDYDFKGLTVPPAWNGSEDYEERTITWPEKPNLSYNNIDGPVPFPRWVKVRATADIKAHFSQGNAFFGGGRDITFSFEQEIVREMMEDDIVN